MIDELARFAGIADSYTDYFGNVKHASRQTKIAILNAMGYDAPSDRAARALLDDLIQKRRDDAQDVAPISSAQAYVPPELDESNVWGFALQLYSLRSQHNWGIGDFGDLARFAKIAADAGADTVGLNPLHQLHLANPESASPYSPQSRLHLNALYIDVESAAAMFGRSDSWSEDVDELRRSEFIDYPGVAAAKVPALRALFRAFLHLNSTDERKLAFRAFQRERGASLRQMATYEALATHFKVENRDSYGWLQWPQAYRDRASTAVEAFAAANAPALEFYQFLQWIADAQLGEAAKAAAKMSIGFYRDLAIGVDANSADVWVDRDAFCLGISVGAPPDPLNEDGQSWGLPPVNPHVLRERAYAPFVQILEANMRHAGALRLDHVMGLERLFFIPQGAQPSEGAYVQYPMDELVEVLARESRRHRCMVIGEDLGTVPPGFRERMAAARIFSCRPLYFERSQDGTFTETAKYPHNAVASTGTHDLTPLAGYWHSLAPRDRAQLCEFLGDLSPGASDLEVAAAAYRALGQSACALVLLQMEDALLQREPVNVPGTTKELPNWRRKLPVALEQLQAGTSFVTIVKTLRESRRGNKERT